MSTAKKKPMDDITILEDPEFKRLSPPLSPAELAQLEIHLLTEGCLEPIVIWNNMIVEGHYRYQLCKKHRLGFKVIQKEFSSREEAIWWLCLHQKGHRNTPPEVLRYQIGKRFLAEKALIAKNSNSKMIRHPDTMMQSSMECRIGNVYMIGREYDISHFSVYNYKEIALAIDKIAEKDSRLSDRYLSGQLRIKKNDLVTVSDMNKWQIRALTNSIIRQKKTVCCSQDVLEALSARDLQLRNQNARERRQAQAMPAMPSVKDMPVHDPDGEVASLSLTIPSWSSSISRIFNKTNMREISDKAKMQLKIELLSLRGNIDLILLAIEEVSNNG